MARTPMVERDTDKYVPRFKEEHVSTGGRKFGIRKVPQTSMFEITGEGAGDIPAGLKGRFTSTGRAERTLKTYLKTQKMILETEQAKQAKETAGDGEPVDILKGPEAAEVEKPTTHVEDTPIGTLDVDKGPKNRSKASVAAKTSIKS